MKAAGLFFALIVSLLICPTRAVPQSKMERISLVSPSEGSVVVAKKPVIKCKISVAFKPENLIISVDGADVTALTHVNVNGFTYKPSVILPPGHHTLVVYVVTNKGEEIQKEFTFETRHTKPFEEFYTQNEITAEYEGVLTKPKSVEDVPYTKVEGNLKTHMKVKEKNTYLKYESNVRYFDQSLPVVSPFYKGINLINYLMEGGYSGEEFNLVSQLGDVQISETPYTVQQLCRRGGKVNLSYKNISVNAFTVKSKELFGIGDELEDGIDLDGNLDEHIKGVSGEVKFFKERMSFKALYVTGGEKEPSYGLWTPEVVKRGTVTGFVLDTDFFDQKFQTFAEVDFSKYDPDRSDEFSYVHDTAYTFGTTGQIGNYTYTAFYEYIGKEYESIANQSMQKDMQGITLQAQANYDFQSIGLEFRYYHDNVEDDSLYPRVTTYEGNLQYSFNKFQSLPISLTYQASFQDSSHEPEWTPSVKIQTDTVTGQASYLRGNWTFALQGAYSFQNDRTPDDRDTTSVTASFSPGYSGEHLSIFPSFSYNMSKYHPTGVRTDNYIFNLDFRGDLLNNRIRYELAGTYNIINATDDSVDQESLNTNFRVAYVPFENYKGVLSPALGIMGKYERLIDHNYPEAYKNDFVLMFFVSTTAMLSF